MSASPASAATAHRRRALRAIALAVAATLALHWVPYLDRLGWPLLIGSTLAHELGHGVGALLIGGRFESLALYPDGSGVAQWSGAFGRLGLAFVAAAGLLGPPLCAFLLLLAGRRERASHVALGVLALLLLLVVLLWTGSWLTAAYCSALAALLGEFAWRGSAHACQVLCVFMAVQLALASFTRADYLFTPTARTGQGVMPSDVGRIAEALWLPYWLWGGLLALVTVALLLLGAWRFLAALK